MFSFLPCPFLRLLIRSRNRLWHRLLSLLGIKLCLRLCQKSHLGLQNCHPHWRPLLRYKLLIGSVAVSVALVINLLQLLQYDEKVKWLLCCREVETFARVSGDRSEWRPRSRSSQGEMTSFSLTDDEVFRKPWTRQKTPKVPLPSAASCSEKILWLTLQTC